MTLSPQPTEDTTPFSDWLSINNAKVRNATLDEVYEAMISSEEIRGDCMRDAIRVVNSIRSTPSPQFNSTELLLLAHDEWKRRQERKHLDDEAAWVSGFIGGFITDKTWAKDKVESLRTQDQP
jgi:hypothetical protein